MTAPFADRPIVCGEFRKPVNMLREQTYDGHASLHDDATAENLGLRAGPIEGPTHFSQFDPLLHHLFGRAWFETGCISAHYQNMVVEGEEVRAFVRVPEAGARATRIWAEKRDGTPVLTGTASVGADAGETEIAGRIARLRPPQRLVLLRDLKVGQKGAAGREPVRMAFDQHMGDLYPFTLDAKLAAITEPCAWYTREHGASSPWGRPIIPIEMISVLCGTTSARAGFRARGPSIGLFAGQEIRLVAGPLFVDHPYEIEREVVALSESARTESSWVRSRIFDGASGALVAEQILNGAVFKASYANYEAEAAQLGRA